MSIAYLSPDVYRRAAERVREKYFERLGLPPQIIDIDASEPKADEAKNKSSWLAWWR